MSEQPKSIHLQPISVADGLNKMLGEFNDGGGSLVEQGGGTFLRLPDLSAGYQPSVEQYVIELPVEVDLIISPEPET
jgi:hypothetical protein